MTRDEELAHFLSKQSTHPRFLEALDGNPPLSSERIKTLDDEAKVALGSHLSREYLRLLHFINGSGYTRCFIASHTTTTVILKRKQVALGIIEQNIEFRKQEITTDNEVAYAIGDGCVFYPEPGTSRWIGRERIAKDIYTEFDTFEDFFQDVYNTKP